MMFGLNVKVDTAWNQPHLARNKNETAWKFTEIRLY